MELEILREYLRAIADEEHCKTKFTVEGLCALAAQGLMLSRGHKSEAAENNYIGHS